MKPLEITVKNIGEQTSVSKCGDPLLEMKLLLEGVGVVFPKFLEFSQTNPKELKKTMHSMSAEDARKLLHEYLDKVLGDYKTTEEIVSPVQPH